ncbi:ATP-dependent Clp protease proteolytic subunit [Terricaulis silvestris]|jgi:ATP-dependent Clp protease protease subunit|uniref:ATP-dependent Clp protease proteolytic subunit n=1 Tax=Terricaulis silvestris TaxID=2686094 RepID=A0A6I6MKY9_9CAUL|nr:ATP-dependent Clp protease proteolytic subunit [Terricaulis silvestris]QGZ93908.1 ATP-dependent Clp protease proteolytic subunit [Terricaulis silvestris]
MTHDAFRLDDEDDKEKNPADGRNAPEVIEKALLEARVVMLTGEVNDVQARRATERLFALAAQNSKPITFVISSPGGHVESGDMIHDVVKYIDAPVQMLGTGWVASAGALIYCAAPRERRFCLPNTRFLLHEPRGGIGGMASDVEIQAREILRMRERLNKIFAEATGQPIDKIKRDMDRDYWMLAEEAKAYGLVGRVVKSASELR